MVTRKFDRPDSAIIKDNCGMWTLNGLFVLVHTVALRFSLLSFFFLVSVNHPLLRSNYLIQKYLSLMSVVLLHPTSFLNFFLSFW